MMTAMAIAAIATKNGTLRRVSTRERVKHTGARRHSSSCRPKSHWLPRANRTRHMAAGCKYLPSQPCTSLHQSFWFCGFCTQCPSSGKITSRDGTPWRCRAREHRQIFRVRHAIVELTGRDQRRRLEVLRVQMRRVHAVLLTPSPSSPRTDRRIPIGEPQLLGGAVHVLEIERTGVATRAP